LLSNAEALSWKLDKDQIGILEAVSNVEVEMPRTNF